MTKSRPKLLFINPWIHDFAAHDLWMKPLGLLRVAEFLSRYSVDINFLDVLDRSDSLHYPGEKTFTAHGKWHRQEIPRPEVLKNIPRQYSRYGLPKEAVREKLLSFPLPDLIFLASHITYWYGGVAEMADLCREIFPGTPVVLGGIYATLMPRHAMKTIAPEHIVIGPGEKASLDILRKYSDITDEPGIRQAMEIQPAAPGLIRKSWKFYNSLGAFPLESSRGCPYSCDFCATPILSRDILQIDPGIFADYMEEMRSTYAFTEAVFYDDALFYRPEKHIKPLLKALIEKEIELIYHTPNGLFARFIDEELAELMYESGFQQPRLSLESSEVTLSKRFSRKVSQKEYIRAAANLRRAGYGPGRIHTYILAGLKDQSGDSIRRSMELAIEHGSTVGLSFLSPIPGTRDYDRYGLPADADPLILNTTVFPYFAGSGAAEEYAELKLYAHELNSTFR